MKHSGAYSGPNMAVFFIWEPERGGGVPAAPPSGSATAFEDLCYGSMAIIHIFLFLLFQCWVDCAL